MSILTPLKKAQGLGSAKDGTHHWWVQRISSIALIPLTLWIAFSVASMSGESYETVVKYVSSPFNIALFCLFLFTAFYHAILGLQVVIEDYIHHEGIKLGMLISMKLLLILLGTTCIIAVLRVAFGH